MARPLALDPVTYEGTYKLIAGSPALDFANLVSYRGTERHHDWLIPSSNLAVWVEAAGMAVTPGADVPALCEFREVLARTFLAVADDRATSRDDLDMIGVRAARAKARRKLRLPEGADVAVWVDDAPSLLGELAIDAAALLTSREALSSVEACPECRWLFLDTTRNRSRRYCDPADCANRARQRRHYHRSRMRDGAPSARG